MFVIKLYIRELFLFMLCFRLVPSLVSGRKQYFTFRAKPKVELLSYCAVRKHSNLAFAEGLVNVSSFGSIILLLLHITECHYLNKFQGKVSCRVLKTSSSKLFSNIFLKSGAKNLQQ